MIALLVVSVRGGAMRLLGRRAIPIAIGAAIVLILALVSSDLLVERFGRLPDEVGIRTLLWSHNLAVARNSLLFGYGPGSFSDVNMRYLGDVGTAQMIWMTNAPHNIALRLMIDGGLPYLILIVVAGCVMAAQVAIAARRRVLDLNETAMLMIIVVILGSASVDIALEVPAIAALMLVCGGLLWGRALVRRR